MSQLYEKDKQKIKSWIGFVRFLHSLGVVDVMCRVEFHGEVQRRRHARGREGGQRSGEAGAGGEVVHSMPAYYADTVGNFQAAALDHLELTLTRAYESDRYKDLITSQLTTWRSQIQDLKNALGAPDLERFHPGNWGIAIEFVVPRKMGRHQDDKDRADYQRVRNVMLVSSCDYPSAQSGAN